MTQSQPLAAKLRAQAQALLALADEAEAQQTELVGLKALVPRDPDALPPPLTVAAVAALFGKSERTILDWIAAGRLRGGKMGNRYYVMPEEVQDALAREARRQHIHEVTAA